MLEADGRERMPDPGRKRRRKLDAVLKDRPEIRGVIDRCQPKVHRPQDELTRDDWYSGQKKTPTLHRQLAVEEETDEIVDIPDSLPGPTADIKRLEPSELLGKLPEGIASRGDSGYQGLDKRHPIGFRPRQKPHAQDRLPEAVAYNTAVACPRIVLENPNHRIRRLASALPNP